jgi:hypothetical protein
MRQVAPDPGGAFTFSYRVIPPDLVAVREVALDLVALGAPFWRLPGGRPELLLLGLLVPVVLGAWRLRHRDRGLLIGWLVVGAAATWLLAQRYPVFFQTKVLVPLGVPVALLLAAGVSWVWERRAAAGLVLMGGLLLVNAIGLARVYSGGSLGLAAEDWRGAARLIADRAGRDDLVLFLPAGHALPFARAATDLGSLPVTRGLPRDFSRHESVLEATMQPPDVVRLDDLLAGHSRVWLVTVTPEAAPHLNVPLAVAGLAERMPQRERIALPGIVIYRFGSE